MPLANVFAAYWGSDCNMKTSYDDPVHRLKVICRQKYILFYPSVSHLRIIYLKYFQLFFFRPRCLLLHCFCCQIDTH